MLADMTLAAQNSRYALYVQASSMAVALLDKATGKAAFSNPYDAARDSSFNGDTEKNLESQLVLTYVDDKNEQSRLWSSADCAELGRSVRKKPLPASVFSSPSARKRWISKSPPLSR